MDNKIIAAARQVWPSPAILPFEDLERFYALAYRQGLEDAAKVCDAKHEVRARDGFPREASTARALSKEIRDLKKEKDHG